MFDKNYDEKIRNLQIKNEELTQIITGILIKLNLFAIEEKIYQHRHYMKQYFVFDEKEIIKRCEIDKSNEIDIIKRKTINPAK